MKENVFDRGVLFQEAFSGLESLDENDFELMMFPEKEN